MIIILVLIVISSAKGFWIPSYGVNLQQSESFVISDLSESDDFYQDEDEMIPIHEAKSKTSSNDDGKYFRLHEMAKRYNSQPTGDKSMQARASDLKKFPERNFDREDPMPWQAGFVDKKGNLLIENNGDSRNVHYLNEMAKDLIEAKIDQKRQEQVTTSENVVKEENYDYGNFKKEYSEEVGQAERQNNTFNFTESQEDESPKDAVETLIQFKEPRNCTAEEAKGLGFGAMKCFWGEARKTHSKKGIIRIIEKMSKIFLVWFICWLIFAIPCWCQRGWCCCCFCCRCCKPRKVIEEAKKFFVDNPAGVYHDENGRKLKYKPTHYEKYAQKRLEGALMKL